MSFNYTKPAIGAAFAIAADKFVLQQPDMQKSLIFGLTVGGALMLANVAEGSIPSFLPDISSLGSSSGKTMSDRVVEIAAGSLGAYAVNRYVLKNDTNPRDMMKKIGVVVAADLVGTYGDQYLNSQALQFL